MAKELGIRFKRGGKIYYFDPLDIEIAKGDGVVVETQKGIELGECVIEPRDRRPEREDPLKPIIRKADEQDLEMQRVCKAREPEIGRIFVEKVAKHGLEMNLIDVDNSFTGKKVTIYFTAEGRVDFRELVKDLAHEFKMRIELRQIGVRDETKMIKGFGACGREVCCGGWLTDFSPVSIRMAKEQNLSLHPVKISGLCNRLMCCLGYEHEAYLELSENLPDPFDRVDTPAGQGTVTQVEILKGRVHVKLDEPKEEEIEVFKKEEVKIIEKNRAGKKGGSGKDDIDEEDLEDLDEDGEKITIKDLKALEED